MPGYVLAVPVTSRAVTQPLWKALASAEQPATVRELHIATAAHPNAIQLRLKRWERAGLITATDERPRRFSMADHAPSTPIAPLLKGGCPMSRKPTQRQRIWTAMRVLKRFDVPTLVMTSQAPRRSVEDFVNILCRAGYAQRTTRGNSMTGEWSIYVLLRRSGPLAPAVTHSRTAPGTRTLVDRNDGSRHDISPGTVSLQDGAREVNHVG